MHTALWSETLHSALIPQGLCPISQGLWHTLSVHDWSFGQSLSLKHPLVQTPSIQIWPYKVLIKKLKIDDIMKKQITTKSKTIYEIFIMKAYSLTGISCWAGSWTKTFQTDLATRTLFIYWAVVKTIPRGFITSTRAITSCWGLGTRYQWIADVTLETTALHTMIYYNALSAWTTSCRSFTWV